MTKNQIKEAISINYIQTIANQIGHKVVLRLEDHGVDMSIIKVDKTSNYGKVRYIDSGKTIECQLKATTEKGIRRTNGFIKYALDVKAYNDLAYRFKKLMPLVLILFILPDDDKKWIECKPNELIIRKHAYWYIPDPEARISGNKSSITISIPNNQRIDDSTFPYLFKLLNR